MTRSPAGRHPRRGVRYRQHIRVAVAATMDDVPSAERSAHRALGDYPGMLVDPETLVYTGAEAQAVLRDMFAHNQLDFAALRAATERIHRGHILVAAVADTRQPVTTKKRTQ